MGSVKDYQHHTSLMSQGSKSNRNSVRFPKNYTSGGVHQPFCHIVTGYEIFSTALNEPPGDRVSTLPTSDGMLFKFPLTQPYTVIPWPECPVRREAVDGQAAQKQTGSKKPTAATTSGCSSSATAVEVHGQQAGQQFQNTYARMDGEATWLFHS